MKREIKEFIEEFTNNFSELYVESFFIKFLSEYNQNALLDSILEVNKNLKDKIKKNFIKKLNNLGYNVNDYIDYLK